MTDRIQKATNDGHARGLRMAEMVQRATNDGHATKAYI